MASFEIAIALVLQNEGGYTPAKPSDPGGETKYGICKRSYPDVDIANLTREDAMEIYKSDFWRYDDLRQEIANKVFDMAVNMGAGTAHRILQESVGTLVVGPVVVDGKFGPQTIALTNSCEPEPLLRELRARQVVHYCKVIFNNPATLPNLLGWARRAVT